MIIIEYTDKNNENPCGSDYTQIFKTGKTARIATNHLKKRDDFLKENITRAYIYNVTNIYNRKTYKILKAVAI